MTVIEESIAGAARLLGAQGNAAAATLATASLARHRGGNAHEAYVLLVAALVCAVGHPEDRARWLDAARAAATRLEAVA